MKRRLLLVLSLGVLLPTLTVLVVAGFGIFHHEWAMEKVARSYVEDLAQNMAYQIDQESPVWRRMFPYSMHLRDWGLSSLASSVPGWLAIVNSEGQLIYASSGAEALASIWNPDIPIGRGVEVKDEKGARYTIAVIPATESQYFVVAAVEWEQLLGPMVRFNHLWLILVIIMVLSSLIAIIPLFKWVIVPLKSLVNEISFLNWGKEKPQKDDTDAVLEIRSLRGVLYDLSRAAIERDQLRDKYVNDIVKIQEEEKARIARDIHDGPLQVVTALIQQIRLFRINSSRGISNSEDHLELAEEAANATVRELREMCDTLSPPWLELGLANALTEVSERLSRHLGIKVNVDVPEDMDLPEEYILSFFRVFQEAVNNSFRHGKADLVTGRVFQEGNEVIFEIRDNGTGFKPCTDLQKLRLEGHRGLANIKERLGLLNGKLIIQSSPGGGSILVCRLPFVGADK
jgi:signal transduction histidine kinase